MFDITRLYTIEAVSVLSTSGVGTTTDSTGRYIIQVKVTDSIYFSYLNKQTPKYPVDKIEDINAFDISIQKRIGELPSVFVRQRNYRMDSLANREEYAKVFNYKKPGLSTSIGNYGGVPTVGLDLAELINMFNFKKNRRMEAFKKRLLNEEREAYVIHRFNKQLVKKLTKLEGNILDAFIQKFKPSYWELTQMNDLELGYYIQRCYKYYKEGIILPPINLEPIERPEPEEDN